MSAVTLTLPPPVSSNRYWRTFMPKGFKAPVTTLSKEAKEYKADVRRIAKCAGVDQPIAGRVLIDVKLYPQLPLDWKKRAAKDPLYWDDGVRSIDLDNSLKVTLDALKGVVITDDGWPVRKLVAERMEPDGEARVVVTITPLVHEQANVQPLLFA